MALGDALAPARCAPGARGRGWAWLPAEEALAGAVIEVSERPLVATNVDFSGSASAGSRATSSRASSAQLADGAGLNVHVRLVEGKDTDTAIATASSSSSTRGGNSAPAPRR